MPSLKKALVIGASSGIGREIAKALSEDGYEVAIASRRLELLNQLKTELKTKSHILQIDISAHQKAVNTLSAFIDSIAGGIDLVVINSGIRIPNPDLSLDSEIDIIDTNVTGFVAMANVAVKHFLDKGSGHLVGISSIACLRGASNSPAYNASKAFISNYMEGLHNKLYKTGIFVTDIRPGFVDTDMVKDIKRKFWVATSRKAANQIISVIKRKKRIAYITKRWAFLALVSRLIPNSVFAAVYRYIRV